MWYLIHVQLARPDSAPLPPDTAALITDSAPRGSRILHVTAHPTDQPDPVVGVYLEAEAPELAESAARVAWWSAVRAQPALAGWELCWATVVLTSGLLR